MPAEISQYNHLFAPCQSLMEELFAKCAGEYPNFGVREKCFSEALRKTACKYLLPAGAEDPAKPVTAEELAAFFKELQVMDLFLSLACAAGNEFAWWEFDRQYRTYVERVARHLASSETDASEVIDIVYVELYGTKVVDGMRMSKFATFSGRGSLKGWLRTVVWHTLVDLHRVSHDEVSLDEMMENVGEGHMHSSFSEPVKGGETETVEQITRNRYRQAALGAIEKSFSALENHEKLLLLYYHVESMKLRQIARLVEAPDSPLRSWFQRKSAQRTKDAESKIHESTVMRWLDKTYAKILKLFREELGNRSGLSEEEIGICMKIATDDLAAPGLYKSLSVT
jgi:DNA-directed RNA polymerase specialized sigma24 family protein